MISAHTHPTARWRRALRTASCSLSRIPLVLIILVLGTVSCGTDGTPSTDYKALMLSDELIAQAVYPGGEATCTMFGLSGINWTRAEVHQYPAVQCLSSYPEIGGSPPVGDVFIEQTVFYETYEWPANAQGTVVEKRTEVSLPLACPSVPDHQICEGSYETTAFFEIHIDGAIWIHNEGSACDTTVGGAGTIVCFLREDESDWFRFPPG